MPPKGGRKHPQQEMIEIDTTNILFIVGGAFAGLDEIIKNRLGDRTIGFGANIEGNKKIDRDNIMQKVLPGDLQKFGLIPEFIGRLPVLAVLDELDEEDFKSVSPTLLAHDQVPPSFVWHTREDGLVPVEQSLNFCLALQEKNVPWELHVFDRGDHGLSVATESSFSRNDHAHAWLDLADSWLKKYYLEGAIK